MAPAWPGEPLVTLEPRVRAHADELFELLADPALYEHLDEAPPASLEGLRERFARGESRKSPDGTQDWLNWVVRDAQGRAAGYVQTTVTPLGEAWVAYVIGRAFQGRGLARAAVRRMLDLVAAGFGVRRFLVVAERGNQPSLRLAQQLGFVPVAAQDPATGRLSPTETMLELRPS